MHTSFKQQARLRRAPIDSYKILGYSRLNSSTRCPLEGKRQPSIKPLSGERVIYFNSDWAKALGETS
jgi:hypothetical protein